MTTEEILERLENVTHSGGSWMARCPSHEDRSASLSIKETDEGNTLLKCHAGCVTSMIVAAMNLTMADLFKEGKASLEDVEPEAIYEYTDAGGRPILEVLRFPGKRFMQRLPGADEFGLKGLGATQKPLFHLPQLVEGIRAGRRIWIVEGEKDVLAMERAGAVATCSIGGAGKWNDSYARLLKGAKAIRIVADKDEPGIAHAEQVATSLKQAGVLDGIELEIVQALHGKDAADHLMQGGTLDDFVERPRAYGGVSLISGDMITPGEVEWLPGWEGFFPYGGIAHLAGTPGMNKSTLTCRLVAEATLRGHETLMITSEDSTGHVVIPRLLAAGAAIERVHFPDRHLTLPSAMDGLQENVIERGIRVIVIDPVDAHLDANVDSYKNQSIRAALAPLAFMADVTHCAVILVGHPNKGQSRDPMMRVGGSIGIPGIARSAMIMGNHPDHPEEAGYRVLAAYKGNWAERPRSRHFKIEAAAAGTLGKLSIRLTEAGTSRIPASMLIPRQGRKDEES